MLEADKIQAICNYMDAHYDQRLSLDDLGQAFHMDAVHLQKRFKAALGISPRQYRDAYRLERFKAALKADLSVTAAMYEAGFHSSSRLYARTDDQLGMNPLAYQQGGLGNRLYYALAACPLGYVLVAQTVKGVAAVKLGDDPLALGQALLDEFESAEILPDEDFVQDALVKVLAYLKGWTPHLDLTTDLRGTAFQKRVWDILIQIPYGETRSYREVANLIGKPQASRAVGSACGKNPVALIIPCHRVLRGDGSLGGYAYGLARKQYLLEMEKRLT